MTSSQYPIVFESDSSDPNDRNIEGVTTIELPQPLEAGAKILAEPTDGEECFTKQIASIGNVDDHKIEMERKCWGKKPLRVCGDVPVPYKRSCERRLVLRVCHPTGVRADVEECIATALVGGVIAAIVTSPEGGAAAFEKLLQACLAAKALSWSSRVHVSAHWEKVCGDWRQGV